MTFLNIPPAPIITTSLAVAFSLLGDSALYAVLPSQADTIGLRLSLVGIILSANRFVRLLTNIWSGYLYDNLLRSWLFIAALVVGALITAIYGLFWQFWVLLIARLMWGTCWSFIRLEGYSVIAKTATDGQYGKSMGYYTSISGLGFLAGSLFGGIFADVFDYRTCFLILASVTLLGVGIIYRVLLYQRPPPENRKGNIPDESHFKENAEEPNVPDNLRLKGDTVNQFAISYIAFVNTLVSFGIVISTLGLLLKRRFGTSLRLGQISIGVASLTGILLSIRWCMNLILAPVFGHLSDRAGRFTLILSGLFLGALSLVGLAFLKRFFFLFFAVIGNYAATMAISVSSDSSIANLAPQASRGRFISWYVTWLDFGAALGPAFGYLIGAGLGLAWVYLAGALLFISATVVCVSFLPKGVQF